MGPTVELTQWLQADAVLGIPPYESKGPLPGAAAGKATLVEFQKKEEIDLLNYRGHPSSPAWCVCVLQLFWSFGAMLEIVLALIIMPTLGWRWLLGLSVVPMGMFLISIKVRTSD